MLRISRLPSSPSMFHSTTRRTSRISSISSEKNVSNISAFFLDPTSTTPQCSPIPHKNAPLHRTVFSITRSVRSHVLGSNQPFFNLPNIFFHDGNTVNSFPPNSLSTTVLFTSILLSISSSPQLTCASADTSLSSSSVLLFCSLFSLRPRTKVVKRSTPRLHHVTITWNCNCDNRFNSLLSPPLSSLASPPSSLVSAVESTPCSPFSPSLPNSACMHSTASLHHATNAFSCTIPMIVRINWNTLNINAASAAPNSLLSPSRRCASAYTAT